MALNRRKGRYFIGGFYVRICHLATSGQLSTRLSNR
ncbi:hypothetical protein BN8_00092 [Fibrisoma limi BUZ 3]|uniref:Uncharacterized protein n=1 Tax=Fibrisoma limi BUZ 3 TaxID=1185876 RepID=I2GBA4_9BACT|nr:hypothetical protein BN8_00092 [Fibrisoma limi BUZ 3]